MWCFDALHSHSLEETHVLCRNVICSALEPSQCAVSRVLFTERGNIYSRREAAEWFRAAGSVEIRSMRMKTGTEDRDGVLLERARLTVWITRNGPRRS